METCVGVEDADVRGVVASYWAARARSVAAELPAAFFVRCMAAGSKAARWVVARCVAVGWYAVRRVTTLRVAGLRRLGGQVFPGSNASTGEGATDASTTPASSSCIKIMLTRLATDGRPVSIVK